jgi:precorrin-6B methylase 2
MTAGLRSYWKKFATSISCHGICFTLFWCLLFAVRLTGTAWYASYRERHFDRRHGVNTAGNVDVAELGVESRDLELSVHYEPTTPEVLFGTLSDLTIQYHDYAFVDLGSGKGLAILVASMFPFDRVIGVEWSPWLADVSRENIRSFHNAQQRCRRIEVVNGDAGTYALPDLPLVIYLFNPFKEQLVRRVLNNIQESLTKNPRHIVLVYYNPIWKNVTEEARFLQLTGSRSGGFGVAIYESQRTGEGRILHRTDTASPALPSGHPPQSGLAAAARRGESRIDG